MNEKIKLPNEYIGYLIGLSAILMIGYGAHHTFVVKPKELKDIRINTKITIATTVSTFYTRARYINYRYTLNKKEYQGSNGARSNEYDDKFFDLKVPNGRYYVVFSSKNPNYASLLPEREVPEFIKEAPPDGWAIEELKKIDPDFEVDLETLNY